jgi:comEA protein
MIEFGKREAGALAAIVGVVAVGGIGWSVQYQRQQAITEDLKPSFADGTTAKMAGPDGTLEIPAKGPEEPATLPSPGTVEASETQPTASKSKLIVVFVSGAVKRPGVYTLKTGDRLYHAVRAAGGFKENADRDALNQAAELRDADQIYIRPRTNTTNQGMVSVASRAVSTSRPRPEMFSGSHGRRVSLPPPAVTVRPLIIEGKTISDSAPPRERGRVLGKPAVEPVTIASQSSEPSGIEYSVSDGAGTSAASVEESGKSSGHSRSKGSATSSKFKSPGDGVVNINTADVTELQKLPGVGPSTALKFIEYRTQIGKFASVEQIQDIKGIGPKKYEKLRPFISL